MARSLRFALLCLVLFTLHPAIAQRYLKLVVQGDSLLAAGRTSDALLAYDLSFKARETSRGAYGIAECHSSLNGTSDTTWYRTALNLAKQEYVKADRAGDKWGCLYRMAYCHQRLGEYEQALKWFNNASCDDRHAYVEIARTLMAMGRYDEALTTLSHCVERFPGESTTLIEECNKALGR
jgi:tetratricopeptide (TPR) repeat protein